MCFFHLQTHSLNYSDCLQLHRFDLKFSGVSVHINFEVSSGIICGERKATIGNCMSLLQALMEEESSRKGISRISVYFVIQYSQILCHLCQILYSVSVIRVNFPYF